MVVHDKRNCQCLRELPDLVVVGVVDGQEVVVLVVHVADPEVVLADAVQARHQRPELLERPVRRPVQREPPESGSVFA